MNHIKIGVGGVDDTRRAGDFAEGLGTMLEGGPWQDSHMGES